MIIIISKNQANHRQPEGERAWRNANEMKPRMVKKYIVFAHEAFLLFFVLLGFSPSLSEIFHVAFFWFF